MSTETTCLCRNPSYWVNPRWTEKDYVFTNLSTILFNPTVRDSTHRYMIRTEWPDVTSFSFRLTTTGSNSLPSTKTKSGPFRLRLQNKRIQVGIYRNPPCSPSYKGISRTQDRKHRGRYSKTIMFTCKIGSRPHSPPLCCCKSS